MNPKKFVFVLLPLLSFVFVACFDGEMEFELGGGEDTDDEATVEREEEPDDMTLPEEDEIVIEEPIEDIDVLKEEYISGCVSGGANEDYCECTFGELQKAMTIEEIMGASMEYENMGEMQEKMKAAATGAAVQCLHLFEE